MTTTRRALQWTRPAGLCTGLLLLNGGVWLIALTVFRGHPVQVGAAMLAYGFGLRHAVDADHIAAIDCATRKLMGEGRRAIDTGLFFSLGHSTVVFLLSVLIAATAVTIHGRFASWATIGALVGTSVSILFLLVIALVNACVLVSVCKTLRRVRRGGSLDEDALSQLLGRRGLLGCLYRKIFALIRYSWHMYPVGLLFGLGFDTATEIGLLGLSASGASSGLSLWSILIYPALFTAGMALIDTADSVLMTGAYAWALKKPFATLYYNVAITGLSVVVALLIGISEALGLFRDSGHPGRGLVMGWLSERLAMPGYLIMALFAVCWFGFFLVARLRPSAAQTAVLPTSI